MGEGFTWDSADLTHDQAVAAGAWTHAKALIEAGDHQRVLLDEITYPLNWGWIDLEEALTTIRNRPTTSRSSAPGRNAPDALIELADAVTDMGERKHANKPGVRAKKGIDY
jgi:cob(I)alamin adenosyltransferase